jgi:hypothetical protein
VSEASEPSESCEELEESEETETSESLGESDDPEESSSFFTRELSRSLRHRFNTSLRARSPQSKFLVLIIDALTRLRSFSLRSLLDPRSVRPSIFTQEDCLVARGGEWTTTETSVRRPLRDRASDSASRSR